MMWFFMNAKDVKMRKRSCALIATETVKILMSWGYPVISAKERAR